MKTFLQTLFCAFAFALLLPSCTNREKSAYAPVIPPPTFQTDPALLGQPISSDAPPAETGQAQEPDAPVTP